MAIADTASGAIGGLGMVAVGHPLDTVKVRLQTQNAAAPDAFKGVGDCLRRTVIKEGVRR